MGTGMLEGCASVAIFSFCDVQAVVRNGCEMRVGQKTMVGWGAGLGERVHDCGPALLRVLLDVAPAVIRALGEHGELCTEGVDKLERHHLLRSWEAWKRGRGGGGKWVGGWHRGEQHEWGGRAERKEARGREETGG